MNTTHQYCTFYLGDQCFGLDVLKVQEIIRSQPMTRVPLAPEVVVGLINLRGQIVTAIDLRKRLELSAQVTNTDSADLVVNVVIQTEDGAVSLLVDEIGDVLEVSESQFERPPETLRGPARDLIQGAYKLPDELLVILDPDKVVSLSESRN